MSLTLSIAIYFVIWWIVLFAVLPIGVRTQGEMGLSCRAHPPVHRATRVCGAWWFSPR